MKKNILVSIVLLSCFVIGLSYIGKAQVMDGIYVKRHVPARKPVPYHKLREADLMWQKRIWRCIDLKQKMNHPLYYPTQMDRLGTRYSFINLILQAYRGDFADVNSPRLTLYAYDSNTDDFTVMLEATNDDVVNAIDEEAYLVNQAGDSVPDWEQLFMQTANVKKLWVKEDWYFDKQRSKMEVRIVGICPIIEKPEYNAQGVITMYRMSALFWVYFLESRPVLANHEVFNAGNDSERRTFDDIFFNRKFSSYIIKETNVYNNRSITQYKNGLDALLEAERIKDWMFKVEHDLWEY